MDTELQEWFNKIRNNGFYFGDGSRRDEIRKQLEKEWDSKLAQWISSK